MFEITAFQRDCLYLIAGMDDPNGLAIKDGLSEYYHEEVNHGRLYPNLDTLVDEGFINKGEQDRRTNYYTLTEKGRDALESRRDWEDQYLDDE